jgi:hypothetical protein
MPVQSVSADGTMIMVTFPLGGISMVGPLNVTVKNLDQGTENTLVNGFEYLNDAQKPKKSSLLFLCGSVQESQQRGFLTYAFDISLMVAVLWLLTIYP